MNWFGQHKRAVAAVFAAAMILVLVFVVVKQQTGQDYSSLRNVETVNSD